MCERRLYAYTKLIALCVDHHVAHQKRSRGVASSPGFSGSSSSAVNADTTSEADRYAACSRRQGVVYPVLWLCVLINVVKLVSSSSSSAASVDTTSERRRKICCRGDPVACSELKYMLLRLRCFRDEADFCRLHVNEPAAARLSWRAFQVQLRTRFQPCCSSKEGKAISDRPNMGACLLNRAGSGLRYLGFMLAAVSASMISTGKQRSPFVSHGEVCTLRRRLRQKGSVVGSGFVACVFRNGWGPPEQP